MQRPIIHVMLFRQIIYFIISVFWTLMLKFWTFIQVYNTKKCTQAQELFWVFVFCVWVSKNQTLKLKTLLKTLLKIPKTKHHSKLQMPKYGENEKISLYQVTNKWRILVSKKHTKTRSQSDFPAFQVIIKWRTSDEFFAFVTSQNPLPELVSPVSSDVSDEKKLT